MYIIHCKMKGVLPVVMTRNTFFEQKIRNIQSLCANFV